MSDKIYFIAINAEQYDGPFSLEELGEKGIQPKTRILRKGMHEFSDAENILEIKDYYFSGKRHEPKPVISTPRQEKEEASFDNNSFDFNKLNEAAEEELRIRESFKKKTPVETVSHPISAPQPEPVAEEIPSVTVPLETPEWYLYTDNVQTGPFTLSQLKEQAIRSRSMVWKKDMPNWTRVTFVPEIAPYVLPEVEEVPAPIDSIEKEGGKDNSYEDSVIYGTPMAIPITGFILSLVYILFAIFIVFGTSFNDMLYEIFANISDGYVFDFHDDHLYTLMGISFVPAVVLSICGMVNAGSAKKLYFKEDIKRSVKKSGAATAYGWGALIYSVMAITISVFVFVWAEL